jgi:hypothetical protein
MKALMGLLRRAFSLLKVGALLALAGIKLIRQMRQNRGGARVSATEEELAPQSA